MQYVLTQAEYDELRTKQKLDLKLKKDQLQQLCTQIADTMPVTVSWFYEGKPTPWGCMLTAQEQWYCDECPVQDICPLDHKAWSK